MSIGDGRPAIRYCVFCEIVAKREPGTIRYEDDDVVVFDNVLRWVPLMLLVVPKTHMTQTELWSSPVLAKLGPVAIEMGKQFCPNGFRVLSNFGREAMQSQEHGHLHVIGGTHLGPYA